MHVCMDVCTYYVCVFTYKYTSIDRQRPLDRPASKVSSSYLLPPSSLPSPLPLPQLSSFVLPRIAFRHYEDGEENYLSITSGQDSGYEFITGDPQRRPFACLR